jgi:rhomboid protease GluP
MSSSGGYWSSSGRYSSSSSAGSGSGRSFFNISKAGRNLAIAIVAGLLIGFVLNYINVTGFLIPANEYAPASYYLVQWNYLVYKFWIVPLFTSMIVVLPGYSGLLDVAFNAFAVIWIDGLFRAVYSAKQYYSIFIITGLAGNLLSLLYGANTVSFGASGGIFGLLAGAVTVDYARNGRFNQQLVIWFVFIFVLSTISGGVDIFAHLGGALVGLALGYVVGRRGRGSRRGYGWG